MVGPLRNTLWHSHSPSNCPPVGGDTALSPDRGDNGCLPH